MKAEIIKRQALNNLTGIVAMEVINGMIYLLSKDQQKLLCLDPYLNTKYQVDLPDFDQKTSTATLTSFSINDYPHIFLLTYSNDPVQLRSWLIKLPTPYNRRHLVWQKDLSDWYNLFEMHEAFSGKNLPIQTAITGQDYFALITKGNNPTNILYFNKAEVVEYFQGHTESAPFPQFEELEKDSQLIDSLVYQNTWFGLSKSKQKYYSITHRESLPFERIRGLEGLPLSSIPKQVLLTEKTQTFEGNISCFGITENPESGIFMAVAIEQSQSENSILLVEISVN